VVELKEGTVLPLENGGEVKVIYKIGNGGQGDVYRVVISDKEFALKWYNTNKINNVTKFKENLNKNILDGAPCKSFLWPKYLTKEYNGNFGYIMELRQNNFCEFSDILNKKQEFENINTIILAALNIVMSFRSLHRQGKSYQDLNDGNFFIDIKTGNVLICDNDNVAPDKENLGIAGKPGYMAPEVVRKESKPEALTDLYSLAVVLFKLFIRHDPLMGKAYVDSLCITEEAEQKLYGTHPVFIFNPNNEENRPVKGVHPNPIKLWPMYPKYLQDAFIQSFCDGIINPSKRLTDAEWIKILIKLRDDLITCPKCGYEFFLTGSSDTDEKLMYSCTRCHLKHQPLVLNINGYSIPLLPDKKLYKCHINNNDDYNEECGRVVKNKKNPNIWAIRNTSQTTWYYMNKQERSSFPPKSIGMIRDGVRIEFNSTTGIICAKKEKNNG